MEQKKTNKNSSTVENTIPTKNKRIIEVTLRGNYLPYLLVKLGEFYNNAEARKFIRAKGVIMNGQHTNNIDFELRRGNTYNIDINEILYRVSLV